MRLLTFAILVVISGFLGEDIHAQGKSEASLADYRGDYSGKGSFTISPEIYRGPAIALFSGPDNGQRATMSVAGTFRFDELNLPYFARFSFARRKFTVSDALLNIEGGVGPVRGRVKVKKQGIIFRGTLLREGDDPLFIDGRITRSGGTKPARELRVFYRVRGGSVDVVTRVVARRGSQ